MMTALSSDDFPRFFSELWPGMECFPWQARLAGDILEGRWPDTLALPTASGKTTILEIVLFALAAESGLPVPKRTVPRRVFFCVDRRIVVDQAHERASRIASRLAAAKEQSGSILARVAQRLRHLGGTPDDESPLEVHELRGGMWLDSRWARTPVRPTIVSTTVDQLGSRLLFRGYGVSSSMRPVHAALAANDALLILDEAHVSRPFDETLEAIKRYRSSTWCEKGVELPFRVLRLSATPRENPPTSRVFALDARDRGHPLLSRRLSAAKPARLSIARGAKASRDSEDKAVDRLARHAFDEARKLLESGAKRLAVIVNRVRTAREVARLFKEGRGHTGASSERTILLLTGRVRPVDRDRFFEKHGKNLAAQSIIDLDEEHAGEPEPDASENRSFVLVATQCVEVGADFDFDAMVTECASLAALRQRFGRLDRLGRGGSQAVIVVREDQASLSDKDRQTGGDLVYGTALTDTWSWLVEAAENDTVDFGVDAIEKLLREADAEQRSSFEPPLRHVPALLPAHLDAWVQTAPVPFPDPDPSPFLHGAGAESADVLIAWREELPLWNEITTTSGTASKELADFVLGALALAPPNALECARAPFGWALRVLSGKSPSVSEVSDLPARAPGDEEAADDGGSRPFVLWRGPEKSVYTSNVHEIRPGDTIVLALDHPATPDLLDDPEGTTSAIATDAGDEARIRQHRSVLLRISPRALRSASNRSHEGAARSDVQSDDRRLKGGIETLAKPSYWPTSFLEKVLRTLAPATWSEEGPPEDLSPDMQRELLALLEEVAEDSATEEWLRRGIDAALQRPKSATITLYPGSHPGLHIQSRARARLSRTDRRVDEVSAAGARVEEDDGDLPSRSERRIPLVDHLAHVRRQVTAYAELLGLPKPLAKDLELAASLHDTGKLDPRFQAYLSGGSRLLARRGEPLAKSPSIGQAPQAIRRARERAGYPRGARHEMLSVRIAFAARSFSAAGDPNLVLHLIASHHGYGRPFAPIERPEANGDGASGAAAESGAGDQSERSAIHSIKLDGFPPVDCETEAFTVGSGIAERFWAVTRRYGWWGAAFFEAILRLADHRASEQEESFGTEDKGLGPATGTDSDTDVRAKTDDPTGAGAGRRKEKKE